MDAYANQIDVLEAMSAILDAQQRVIALAQQDMVTILDQTWKALYATIFDGGSLVADLVLGVAGAVVSIATAGADTAMAAVGAAFIRLRTRRQGPPPERDTDPTALHV